jgi:Transposase Tn5 dimerisation domain
VCAARAACPTTHFVSVGDREADVYDLFIAPRPTGVDLLIRARSDRQVAHPERTLWQYVLACEVGATIAVQVRSREGGRARTAHLTVRWRQVTLDPPKKRTHEKLPPVTLWAILAREDTPPKGVEPIQWRLLTTLAVVSPADALRYLEWYACRWGIEVWHKVLKSGCQIQARELQTADRLMRCLAVFSVVAWYVLFATTLARDLPDQPCTLLLDQDQWQALYCLIHKTSRLPAKPPTLRQAIRWIAKLGGFLGRKGDGEPGIKSLWQGLQRLFDMTLMYQALRPSLGV